MVASNPPVLARIHRFFAGTDGPEEPALPVGEFFHPLVLGAVVLLIANDQVLKGSAVPGWLTGKLSDFAGLLFFPLLITASVDALLCGAARLGLDVDFSLRQWKLVAATTLTAASFAAIKLFAPAASAAETALAALGFPSVIVCDPTDVFALPMVAVAYWLGRREIWRVPLGRIEIILRDLKAASPTGDDSEMLAQRHLADVRALRPNDGELLDTLGEALVVGSRSGDFSDATRALQEIRGETAR